MTGDGRAPDYVDSDDDEEYWDPEEGLTDDGDEGPDDLVEFVSIGEDSWSRLSSSQGPSSSAKPAGSADDSSIR